MTNAEIVDYDLSTTDTIVELTATSSDELYGFDIDATASADFVIEIRGGTVGFIQVDEFLGAAFVSSGFTGPEVVDIRIRNTSTANGTADVILGSGGR
jgi:uncharacterized protein (DUF697 family)